MVAFTLSTLWWVVCALFRFFVITWTSYGIYKFFKDKIDDRQRVKYIEECQEKHQKEMEEAKKRIAESVKKSK